MVQPRSDLGDWAAVAAAALEHDVAFVEADAEASRLIESGEVGPGISGADLRARYRPAR